MTLDEAHNELMKRFPGETVAAEQCRWFHKLTQTIITYHYITYNFIDQTCSRKDGSSFEECFEKLDQEQNAINKVLKERGILFKQF